MDGLSTDVVFAAVVLRRKWDSSQGAVGRETGGIRAPRTPPRAHDDPYRPRQRTRSALIYSRA